MILNITAIISLNSINKLMPSIVKYSGFFEVLFFCFMDWAFVRCGSSNLTYPSLSLMA
jgi:hypothetical protein